VNPERNIVFSQRPKSGFLLSTITQPTFLQRPEKMNAAKLMDVPGTSSKLESGNEMFAGCRLSLRVSLNV
jgi:hypothetical protein